MYDFLLSRFVDQVWPDDSFTLNASGRALTSCRYLKADQKECLIIILQAGSLVTVHLHIQMSLAYLRLLVKVLLVVVVLRRDS